IRWETCGGGGRSATVRIAAPMTATAERATKGRQMTAPEVGLPQSGPPSVAPPLVGDSGAARHGSAVTPESGASTSQQVMFEVKRIIVGQDRLIERILVGLLARGHLLIEGVPGVAKTLAVETFATAVGGTFARLQFTPDLVPSDLLGTRIYRAGREEFDI